MWFIDSEVPSIEALVLVDGRFQRAAFAAGTERVTIKQPFGITPCPADLVKP